MIFIYENMKLGSLDNIIDIENWENWKQAGAELGQAQLKLGLGFTSIKLH